MAVELRTDELNISERREAYREYFDVMRIPVKDKRKRERLAEELDDIWLDLFAIYLVAMEVNREVDEQAVRGEHIQKIEDALRGAGIREEVIQDYIRDVVNEELDVTQRRYREDPYWTSQERSTNISENDTNIVFHAHEYLNAVASGKRSKQWLTMKDDRVRETHAEVDEVVMPIDEPFVVGDSLLMFPGDVSLGASVEEIANCRCAVTYF